MSECCSNTAQIKGEHACRIATDAGHIARQHGLHDETLDRADEQRGCGIRIEVRMQFALCLPGFEQATQPFAIVADQGLGHALRESLARSLQLPEQHSRHTRSEEHTSELQSIMRNSS